MVGAQLSIFTEYQEQRRAARLETELSMIRERLKRLICDSVPDASIVVEDIERLIRLHIENAKSPKS